MIRRMAEPAPWEVVGLPGGIRPSDFEEAECFYMIGVFNSPQRLIPAHPERPGSYFSLSGTQYGHNVKRLERLVASEPMHLDKQGKLYYPAVLLPDPTEVWRGRDLAPIAVCSNTGYIGSAWQHEATLLRPEVDAAHDHGKLIFSRLCLTRVSATVNPTGWTPEVWLPNVDTYNS